MMEYLKIYDVYPCHDAVELPSCGKHGLVDVTLKKSDFHENCA